MNKVQTWIAQRSLGSIFLLALLLIVVFPLSLDIFRLNLVGKYLTYAFVALGLVMLWGHAGILSLGQGVFFGLGGYMMAMFLKLEASDPESTKIQSTPGIPDFMDWNQLTALPWWWTPFKSLPFALAAVVIVPMLLAFLIGFAMFNATPEEQKRCANDISTWLSSGKIRSHIGATFSLKDASRAHMLLEENTLGKAGTLSGKVILLP